MPTYIPIDGGRFKQRQMVLHLLPQVHLRRRVRAGGAQRRTADVARTAAGHVVVVIAVGIAVIVVHVACAAGSTATATGHCGRGAMVPGTATIAGAATSANTIALRK